MPKLIRVNKNRMQKATLYNDPAQPGYVEITADMLRRTNNLSDLTDAAEARANLGVSGLDDLSVSALPSTIVYRDDTGKFKILDAVDVNEPVTLRQLNNESVLGKLNTNATANTIPLRDTTGRFKIQDAQAVNEPVSLKQLNNTSVIPVGFIYFQLRGQLTPDQLFKTSGKWQDISSTYSGEFFRAVGMYSGNFGSVQNAGLPNIEGLLEIGQISTEGGSPGGCFYFERGAMTQYVVAKDTRNETDIRLVFDAKRSSPIYGRSNEVTPRNSAIRIWKKIA